MARPQDLDCTLMTDKSFPFEKIDEKTIGAD